ncbi:MAG: hypothetical protein CMI16_05355 [Opitutaceae bacterium]|nr:hypothetical protein [Opitutaceae bacterium]|tara:strand:+ start:405 stop:656 length:252 start_codon:yes stop_codon:yes gene_type:complete
MSDPKRILLLGLAAALPLFVGCSVLKKEPQAPLTAQTEQSFRDRWIETRGAELVAKGSAPSEAQRQAMEEFRNRYGYTNAAKE